MPKAPRPVSGAPKKTPKTAESYEHKGADAPMRPDVGTQAQFRKKKPPATYTDAS